MLLCVGLLVACLAKSGNGLKSEAKRDLFVMALKQDSPFTPYYSYAQVDNQQFPVYWDMTNLGSWLMGTNCYDAPCQTCCPKFCPQQYCVACGASCPKTYTIESFHFAPVTGPKAITTLTLQGHLNHWTVENQQFLVASKVGDKVPPGASGAISIANYYDDYTKCPTHNEFLQKLQIQHPFQFMSFLRKDNFMKVTFGNNNAPPMTISSFYYKPRWGFNAYSYFTVKDGTEQSKEINLGRVRAYFDFNKPFNVAPIDFAENIARTYLNSTDLQPVDIDGYRAWPLPCTGLPTVTVAAMAEVYESKLFPVVSNALVRMKVGGVERCYSPFASSLDALYPDKYTQQTDWFLGAPFFALQPAINPAERRLGFNVIQQYHNTTKVNCQPSMSQP